MRTALKGIFRDTANVAADWKRDSIEHEITLQEQGCVFVSRCHAHARHRRLARASRRSMRHQERKTDRQNHAPQATAASGPICGEHLIGPGGRMAPPARTGTRPHIELKLGSPLHVQPGLLAARTQSFPCLLGHAEELAGQPILALPRPRLCRIRKSIVRLSVHPKSTSGALGCPSFPVTMWC